MKLNFNEFASKPCRSSDSFQFVSKKPVSLNLIKISKQLEEKGVFIDFTTEFLLSMKVNNKKVSLFRSGKIIIKEIDNEETAKQIAEKIFELIE
jgi:ArsR family metal-binding transcriptional regulator